MAIMSTKYEKIKSYHELGLWNKQMVRNAAGRWITEAEAEDILNSAHSADEIAKDMTGSHITE